MERLKVGQRIEIYKVLTDGRYPEKEFIPGTLRPGKVYAGAIIEVLPNSCFKPISMFLDTEVELVGAMWVTKLKEPVQSIEPSY